VLTSPADIQLDRSELLTFNISFGLQWNVAVDSNRVLNVTTACQFFSVSLEGLFELWSGANKVVKMRHGLYCARVKAADESNGGNDNNGETKMKDYFIINGFYGQLRNSFVSTGGSCRYLVVQWNEDELSYKDFAENVVGHRDPELASPFSIRGMIHSQWQALGILKEPDELSDCLYVSKSAFAALVDRHVWSEGFMLTSDPFYHTIVSMGISPRFIQKLIGAANNRKPGFAGFDLGELFGDDDHKNTKNTIETVAYLQKYEKYDKPE